MANGSCGICVGKTKKTSERLVFFVSLFEHKSREIRVQRNIRVSHLLSLAALHAEGGGDGGEDGDDEVDYGFPGFSFHDVSFFEFNDW